MKILLVDDSKSARYALRLQLQRHGIEVETADSAESAFDMLKGELPDAIMMDHMMPGLNGFEALEVIREDPRTAHLPVVMCTSHEEADFVAAARRNGAVGILPKSTAPERLPDILAQLREAIAAATPASARSSAEQPSPIAAPIQASPAAPASSQAPTQVPEGPPGLNETRVLELVDSRLADLESALGARMDERIAGRVSALLAPMLEDLRQDLTERLSAEVRRLLAEGAEDVRRRIDERADETRRMLDAGLAEVRDVRAGTDRADATAAFETAASRMVRDTLPSLVKLEIEAERGQIMDLVEQYLREFGPKTPAAAQAGVEDSGLATENALGKAADVARREARTLIEPALDRANQIADAMLKRVDTGLSRVYIAIAGAAAVGLAAAALVYLLLS